MESTRLSSILIRSCMVLFWIGVLVLCLFFNQIVHLFKHERSINIFTWPVLIDVGCLRAFERETGIKIHVSYYETNEELFSKLRATKGVGYDLVIPSDYVVQLLIKENLLKKIDVSKLSMWKSIDPKLLGLYFDPTNEYTVPFFWAVYGLGVDTRYYNGHVPDASWSLIFDKNKVPSAVGMFDASRESVILASTYLFGNADFVPTADAIQKIKNLLLEQKHWVSAYTESNVEHLLLSKAAPVVVASGPDILRIKRAHPYIDFIVPKEGSFALVDSFAIPAASSKESLVYELINYLLRPDIVEHHRSKFGMCSPLKSKQVSEEIQFCPGEDTFSTMKFFRTSFPETLLNDIWIELMSR